MKLNRLAIFFIVLILIGTLYIPYYKQDSVKETETIKAPLKETFTEEPKGKIEDQGKHIPARKEIVTLLQSAKDTEKEELLIKLGGTYLKEGKDKGVLGRTPYYNLAFTYYLKVPMMDPKYDSERKEIVDTFYAQTQELIKLGAYDQIPFYLKVFKEWKQDSLIAELQDKLEQQISLNTLTDDQLKAFLVLMQHFPPKGETRRKLAEMIWSRAINVLTTGSVEESYLYGEIAFLLGERPNLLKNEYIKLLQKQIVKSILKKEDQVEEINPYIAKWQIIEKDDQQKKKLPSSLITNAEKLWNEHQYKKAVEVLFVAAKIVPDDKEMNQKVQKTLSQMYKQALETNNMFALTLVMQGMEKLNAEEAKQLELLTEKSFLKQAANDLEQNEYERAYEKSEWILKRNPGQLQALNNSLLSAYGLAYYSKTLELLKHHQFPGVETNKIEALSEYFQGDSKKGERLLTGLEEKKQLDNELLLRLAIGKLLRGDIKGSFMWLQKAPPSLDKQIVKLGIYLEEGNWEKLIEAIDKLPMNIQKTSVIQGISLVANAKIGNKEAVEKLVVALNDQLGEPEELKVSYPLKTLWDDKFKKYDPNYTLAIYYYRGLNDPSIALTYLNVMTEPSIDALLLQALILTDLTRYDEALGIYADIPSNSKHEDEILESMAKLYLKMDYYSDAVIAYKELINKYPKNMEIISNYAEALHGIMRDDLALIEYAKLEKEGRLTSTEKVKMLQSLLNVEQFDRVNSSVTAWLKDKSPPNQLEKIQLMKMMLITGNTALLKQLSEEVGRGKELSIDELEALLTFYLEIGSYSSFEQIANKNENVLIQRLSGLILLAKYNAAISQIDKALEYSKEALDQNPWYKPANDFIRTHLKNIPELKNRLADKRKVMEEHRSLLSPILDYDSEFFNYIQVANDLQKGVYKVTSSLDELLQKYSQFPEIDYLFGKGNDFLEKYAIAEKNYQKALELANVYPEASFDYNSLLLKKGDYVGVVNNTGMALRHHIDDIGLLLLSAAANRAQGNYIDAITALKSINRYRPNQPEPYVQLAEIYIDINNLEDARHSLEKAMELQPDNIAALTLLLKVLYNPLVVVEFGNQKLIEKRQQEIYDKLHNLSPVKAEELLKLLSPASD